MDVYLALMLQPVSLARLDIILMAAEQLAKVMTFNVLSNITLGCPKYCSSCTDFQTCQVCQPGYGFYNNNCVLCPSATFLDNDGFCKGNKLSY